MYHKDARETDDEGDVGGGRDGALSLMTVQISEKLLNFKVTGW